VSPSERFDPIYRAHYGAVRATPTAARRPPATSLVEAIEHRPPTPENLARLEG